MTFKKRIRDFLLDPSRRRKITINGIETDTNMPGGNLTEFLVGKWPFPQKYLDKLVVELKTIGFGVIPNLIFQITYSSLEWGNTLSIFEKFPNS